MDSTSILYSKNTPATFLEWLELQERISPDYSINFKLYEQYISKWVGLSNNKLNDSNSFFTRLYIDLLREITLNFSTEEEKRFIVNFDYSKTDNLDIIIPFFIDKLKDICIFYSYKRESIRDTISQLPYKGTNLSVKKVIKQIILNDIDNRIIEKESEGRITFPSLSAINKNLEIKIEELFDASNYYDPDNHTNIVHLSSFSNIEIDKDLYLNFKEAIKRAIKEYPLFIDSLLGNFSINYTLSGNELELLRERDFVNYIKTLSSEDLKLNLQKRLAPKYVSTDFYYLSVGNTINESLSGLLFTTKPLTGSSIQNLTNRQEARIASVQNLDNLYTAYEMGKFFIPNFTGVLQYNAFDKKYYINYKKLTPNTTYVFPDPEVIEGNDSPISFKIKVNWNKIGPEGGYSFGNIISESHYQRFFPYESYSQDIANTPLGLSLQKDNVDFWNGEKSSVWTEKDLWPGLDEVDRLPLQTRLESLLIDKGVMTDWYADIYGNQFGLYKELDTNTNLYNRKKVIAGTVYVKNTVTNLVSTFDHFFNKLFFKYPQKVSKELFEPYISFYSIKNVFVVETKNYVIIDSYECDLETGKFINTLLPGIYIPKHEINENLEKFVNSFYVESKDKLYLCFLKLLPSLSASNYKSIVPSIYELDIESLNFVQKYPGLKYESTFYSLSSKDFKEFPEIDLRNIEGGKFSFKERFDIFNLTYYAFNLNNVPYIVNEQFAIEEGNNYLNSYGTLLNKPYLYAHDVNFSNPNVDHTLRYSATYSEPVGSKDLIKFKWEIVDEKDDNSYFCSNINPVIINKPGSHYVQFDWDKYVFGNVFIGCEAITVANIDGKNVIGFRDKTPPVILDQEEKIYKIRDYNFFGYIFSLNASRPYNTSNGIIHFTVTTKTSGFEGNFCNNLFSIYRKVKVSIIGDGVGTVYGEPACLDCPPVCEFVYPLYSTITLIPSANPRSIFAGWKGTPCEGLASNCAITVSDNTSISAIFNKIPYYKLRVSTNLPGTTITTTDGNIFCGENCEYEYREGTLVGLSAGPAPIGKMFETFKGGPLCGVNNPCGVTMANNYNITAIYVDAFTDLSIHKEYFNLEYGYILARTKEGSTRTLFIPSADRALFYSKNVSGMTGSVTCSLSPDTPIYGYAEFFNIPRSTFISNTGRGEGEYIFGGWKGSPCNNSTSIICSYISTKSYTITGVVTVPTYTLSIKASGDGVFYIESEDGGINCGTRGFINSRRDCFNTYLSGTFIYLSGVCAPGSKLYALCANEQFKNVSDVNNIIGQDKLELGLYITNNTVLTAVGNSEDKRTLTIIKSGSEKAFESIISVSVVGFNEFFIDRFIEKETYILPKNSEIIITPIRDANFHRHVYTTGFSGLYYNYNTEGLTINEGISSTLFINDFLIPNTPAINIESNGAPYYNVLGAGSIITVDNRESYLTLDSSATAIVVYQELEFIARQENEDDPIYTEDQLYIYTK